MKTTNFKSREGFFLGDPLDVLYKIFENYKKGNVLYVQDFDDTLYSREGQLELKGLANNRGNNGNIWILAVYSGIINKNYSNEINSEIIEKVGLLTEEEKYEAYKKFVDEFYQDEGIIENIKELVKLDIENGIKFNVNLILTAGEKMFQELKINKLSLLGNIPLKVVKKSSQKVKIILLHVLELGYIPEKINIYEDRPEFFYEYGQIISNILGTKIIVNKIEINEKNIAIIIEKKEFNPKRSIN